MMKRLCGLLASGAVVVAAGLLTAQDRTNPNIQSEGGKVKPGQTSDQNASEGGTSAQGQRGTGTTQRGQSGQTRQGQTQRGQQGQQGAGMSEAVDQYIATCLINKNQGEIELSKLAQQRAESQEVKQFAAKMIEDHTKFVQQLQTAQGENQGAAGHQRGTQSGSKRTNRPGQPAAGSNESGSDSRDAGSQRSDSKSDRSDSNADSQDSASGSQNSAKDSSDTRDQSTRIRLGQGTRSNAAAGAANAGSDSIPVQTLISVDNDIHERVMQAMRQELEQKQGREFDKAFMGAQCHMHLQMVSALEALQTHVSQDLQQTIRQGAETSKQHLTQAKQVKEQMEGQSGAAKKDRDDKTSRKESQKSQKQ